MTMNQVHNKSFLRLPKRSSSKKASDFDAETYLYRQKYRIILFMCVNYKI
jgi:hypothetical protein